jgi:L-aminopeptidase/D-esterase-like protein
MAQDGLARAIRPVHAPFDGDVVFALSTARRPLIGGDAALARLGALAADTLVRAVARGVFEATAWPDAPPGEGPPAWRDRR